MNRRPPFESPVAAGPVPARGLESAPSVGAPPPREPGDAQGVHELLAEVLELLAAEKTALIRLDREAIEAFAARKTQVDACLQAVSRDLFDAAAVDQLREIRQRAFDNRLLLTHARACTRGVLSLLAPEVAPGYCSAGAQGKLPPVALDLKG